MIKVILPILFFGSFFLLTSCRKLIEENITLTCSPQMYACEKCPQFLVQEIETNNQTIKKNLLNKDIYIVDSESKKDISEEIKDCLICYIFTVTGRLEKREDNYILLAKNVEKKLYSSCCNK